MHSLNIIGCGHLGKTLGRLWVRRQSFQIGAILNSTTASAAEAVDFVGNGSPLSSMAYLQPADFYLIGVPDDRIAATCDGLANSGLLRQGDIVFHCSGALPSSVLAPARRAGAMIASVHPVKSFADPTASAETFAGTYCGMEGEAAAITRLTPAFEAIGARLFAIDPCHKTLYHAAAVIACNYLTALIETAAQTYVAAGLERDTAMQLMQPMVQDTVTNIFRYGPTDALTGPIARGDHATVARQLDAVTDWNPPVADLYRDLGQIALQLSEQKGNASTASLERLAAALARASQ